MPDSSPFVARIAELLQEHGVVHDDWDTYVCECERWHGGSVADHAEHVAEVLVASLHTQEWTWSWPAELTGTGSPGYGFSVPSRSEAEAEADPYMTIVSRFVTPWEES